MKKSSKRKERKQRLKENKILKAKKIIFLSLLALPVLFVLFVISRHSNLLVVKPIAYVVICLLIVFILCFIYGLYVYILEFKNHKLKLFPKRIVRYLITIFMILYIGGSTTFLVLLYSPYERFRNWLITTAMQTMTHKYLCQWFYSEDEINEVMSKNYVKESGESTDPNLIDKKETVKYANE